MKQFKKAAVILMALVMVFTMSMTAFATDVTINGGVDGSTYAAYKLLNAADGGEGKFAYTLNDTYTAILQAVTGKTEQTDIVDYIGDLDAEGIRAFADSVYAQIAAASITADYTTTTDSFAGVDQGYYLIAETVKGSDADTLSLVMLDTAGQEDVTVNTKEGLPTVEKKIEEKNDTTGASSWGDSADYDVNDVINYTLTGTVSAKYAGYKSYYYSFVDTMDKGLTYNNDAKVYVVNGDSKVEVTDQFTFATTTNSESGYLNGVTITANLKELTGVTIDASTEILVEYTATLNEYALKGEPGNLNEVYLEYENDPYHTADGDPTTPDKPGDEDNDGEDDDENDGEEPSKTPIDVTIVFTFKTVVNKVDAQGTALKGAGFTLYKNIEGTWTAVGEELKGTDMVTFTFDGVDVGEYKLVETTVPVGYNKCEDIVFEVVATYDNTKEPVELTALEVRNADGEVISEGTDASFTATLSSGIVETNVVNLTGAELPETGGIGTTIFYIVGAVLVLGAVVLLVAKQRMKTEE